MTNSGKNKKDIGEKRPVSDRNTRVSGEDDNPSDIEVLWDEEDEFGAELHRIARSCIENDWHRTDCRYGGWHYFTTEELAEINQRTGNRFDYGYCFLDDKGGTEGLIRLEQGHINPKWSFWLDGDQFNIEFA